MSTIHPLQIPEDVLHRNRLAYICTYRLNDSGPVLQFYRPGKPAIRPVEGNKIFIDLWQNRATNHLLQLDSIVVCEVYRYHADSLVDVIAYPIPREVADARSQLMESLRIYTSLSLLKRSVVEGHIIWGVATVLVVIFTLLAIYTARALSTNISYPIHRLAEGMQKVANGELSARVDVKARDELHLLVESFNRMASDLQNSQQRLVKAERLAAWRDVARRISHEIKNIITPVQISLYRLQQKTDIQSERSIREALVAIEDEMQSLRRLAEAFSEFARMPPIQPDRHDINQIIDLLVPLLEGGTRPIRIEKRLDRSLPHLYIDRDQIKRAIHNLLKNSVEASPMNGCVEVQTYRMNENRICIEIIDHGDGMNSETLSKIFEPYYSTKQRGMGLGLSIVKRIVDEHGGDINFESKPGHGTTVRVILPMESADRLNGDFN